MPDRVPLGPTLMGRPGQSQTYPLLMSDTHDRTLGGRKVVPGPDPLRGSLADSSGTPSSVRQSREPGSAGTDV